jgi:antitoxin (DNA-binding transcriptional repressor) of toxin-antitoxin stability system
MTTISLQEAQMGLAKLIHELQPGQMVTITENDRPVARLVPVPVAVHPVSPVINPDWPGYPHPGCCEGMFVVPDDFKALLEDMREYME